MLTATMGSVSGVLLMLSAARLGATTLYVAPDGNDGWSGRLQRPNAAVTDGPLASLQGARDAIRRMKANGPLTEAVTVQVADGVYVLDRALTFTPEDSGTEACPITYEAAPNARPVFIGGRQLTGLQPGEGNLWVAQIPEVASGDWNFEQLWVNGRRAIRARTPNGVRAGETYVPRYFYIAGPVGFGIDPATGQRANLENRAFKADPKDIEPLLKLSPEELKDVNVVVYYAWESARLRPLQVEASPPAPLAAGEGRTADATSHVPTEVRVVTTGPGTWKFNWLGRERYHLEGFREALDEPGEWYLDRAAGKLYYWPLPGDDINNVRMVAPVLDELVVFRGEPETGLPVEHITLRGLAFHYNSYTTPPQGHGDGQAAVGIPAAIMADGAANITLEACEVAHTGTYGVWFRRGCERCIVRGCRLYDLGAGGVKIGETTIRVPAEQTHHITVDNCLIHGGGRLFTGAVGVWIGQSSDNRINHNDISDLFYTGVSVGWSWGYADTACKRNRVEFNHIHHLGWGVMSDMGGVYTLGIQDGASVSNNVIHDVWSYNKYGYAGLGLYNDEGSTHITMENNLVYDCLDMTYHQHYGKENVVRNNILVDGRNAQLSVHREEPHLSSTFENNIVYFRTGKLFWAPSVGGRKLKFDRNVYWNTEGQPLDFMGLSFADWQKAGQDANSVIADPRFVDAANRDFRLKPDSPALKLGFKEFDYTQAGIQDFPDVAAEAAKLRCEPVPFAPDPPPPPPLVINEDFEDYPVGAQPLNAEIHVETKGDSIAVTDEAAATGTQSLKFTDAEGLRYSYDPHLVYTPSYTEGLARCSYDIRLEQGAELWQEYRDWSGDPYTIGPSLSFIGGKLHYNREPLMDVPLGQWLHVEVSFGLGEKATGTCQVSVTLPGEKPKVFGGLKVVTPGWKKLTWVGFVSNATRKTVFYLDNVRLGVE